MRPADADDWTSAWQSAAALALSTWTRSPQRLGDAGSARLLAAILEVTVLECRLGLLGWVVLPGALHLVATREGPGPAPPRVAWPTALGRIKGLHGRCDNRRLGLAGSVWRPGARIRPLLAAEVRPAVLACERAPVSAGLVVEPTAWPHSSAGRRR